MILFLVKILDRISLVLSTFYCTFIFKRVGKNSYIYRPLRVIGGKYVTIGKNVTIQKSLRIEAIDTWHYVLDYHKDKLEQKFTPKITISDNVGIEQNVHITAATDLEIGDGSQIMPNVCITNIDHDYKNVKISPKDQLLLVNQTIIGDNCVVGMNSVILAGTILGNHCIVGANSVVKGVFPSYSVVCGVPARIVKQYSFNLGKWNKCDE